MRLGYSILMAGVLTATAAAQQTRPAIPASAAPASAPAPQAATADARPTAVSSDTYIIGAGDTLQLTVWKEPNFSTPATPVRPDGQISLALLGDVPAANMTPVALSNDIAVRLKKYVNDPLVTVTVLSVRPKEVFLIGEIAKTGPVVFTPEMTTLQVIAAAGGLSPYAKKKIYILRKGPNGEQKIAFDYKKAIRTGDQQGVVLKPGDTIVVP